MMQCSKFAAAFVAMFLIAGCSNAAPKKASDAMPAKMSGGAVKLSTIDPGTKIDLTTAKWMFKPGYELAKDEQPQNADARAEGYRNVPVPQMLSRIEWWLDDSEDFKKWERARLEKLNIDPDKIEDGWYRLNFDVPKDWPADRHLWVEFDGVAMRSTVYCNGAKVGHHDGMFSRFSFDLSPHLKPGERNLLAVFVSMEKIPKTDGNLGEAVTVNLSAAKVISMSKGMFGPLTPNKDNRAYDLIGIWQPVRFEVRGTDTIEDVWFKPMLDGATIDVEASAAGFGQAMVKAKLTDAKSGELLAEWSEPMARAETGATKLTLSKSGLKPKLWTPENPNLYRLEVSLGGSDTWSHNVGFRTFDIKGNQLYLNGKPYWLRGANQLPYGKNPWDTELPKKLIQYLHDANVNSTRTHATPWNEAWLDAADEIGLGVSVEGIRPWALAGKSDQIGHEIMPPDDIVKHWLMENEDVVKRCRNHPSVFIFTVGNEMMLRDKENLKKWQILSDVGKQTKQLAPDHPVVISSDYVRDPKFYEEKLKPGDFYDGDMDDMHKYNGWYADSTFIVDSVYEKEASTNKGSNRPLIGQEFATGYPDLDTGLPVLRYTRDLVTPQAWVGVYAYPGNDPKTFLAEHAKVTKRWAEQLRWSRGDVTSGFSLFSAECWFRHSYTTDGLKPYPTLDAVNDAWAPVGLALETTQRRFYSGQTIETNVYVTNDDINRGDLSNAVLIATTSKVQSASQALAKDLAVPYYATKKVPVTIQLPAVKKRTKTELTLMLKDVEGHHITVSTDSIEIFPEYHAPEVTIMQHQAVIAKGESLDALKPGGDYRQRLEAGETVIVMSPDKSIVDLFPNDLLDVKNDPVKDVGEFVDWYLARGTKLVKGLEPMDLKWWARKGDWRAFVTTGSHRLKPGGTARELLRYIPPHSYISADKVPDQYRVAMSEIPIGKGRLWICDVDFDASVGVDPVAQMFKDNLIQAAMDPNSTKDLKPVPSHEELLKNTKPLN